MSERSFDFRHLTELVEPSLEERRLAAVARGTRVSGTNGKRPQVCSAMAPACWRSLFAAIRRMNAAHTSGCVTGSM